jgi:hypothetical protein
LAVQVPSTTYEWEAQHDSVRTLYYMLARATLLHIYRVHAMVLVKPS